MPLRPLVLLHLVPLLMSVPPDGRAAAGLPDGVETLAIGSPAPAFDLPGIDGTNHRLSDYGDARVLAVLFTCNHCPTAQAAEARVIDLVDDYADRSFQLVAISPNDPEAVRIDELGYSLYGDSLEDMKRHAAERGFNFPYLYDGEPQAAARAYGARTTPHIFIFDASRKLRYRGRIDDSKYAGEAEEHDARNAIDALLAGRPVPVETTRAFGCSTKWSHKRDQVRESAERWKNREVTLDLIDAEGVRGLRANDTNKLRLINVWATWCGPCTAEFPDLVQLGRQFESRGFDFISISVDDPTRFDDVLLFLRSEHAALGKRTEISVRDEGRTTNNYLFAQGGDIDALAKGLDPELASLPHTLLVAPGGEIVARYVGEIDVLEVRRAVLKEIGRFYTPKRR